MKIGTLFIATALLGSLSMADDQALKKEGVGYIKMLGGTLKSQLQENMKKDPSGLAAAAFCAGSAESITKEINAKLPKHASVRRTALKTRNASNKADAIDEKVINEYIKAIEEKSFDPKSPIKLVKDENSTRVYKPLLTQGACLKCHGSAVSPEITKLIKEQYPQDQAIDFKEGSLRGVIVAEIKNK